MSTTTTNQGFGLADGPTSPSLHGSEPPPRHASGQPAELDLTLSGRVLDQRYRIVEFLGEGGMGVVVKAIDERLQRTVALKLLHAEYADQEDVLHRFDREARIIAQLRSPHVVAVLDVSMQSDSPYIVLEYLEGETLESRVLREGPLPLGDAVRFSRQVAEALEEAHGAGILHRDIKPGNVFLARQPNNDVVAKILDFGTARFYDMKRAGQTSKPTITKQYETFGSPAYMPPEQISSARNTDERSDIWALGTVLYEAVTGNIAFEGEYPDVFVVISTQDPKPLRSQRPDAPVELALVIDRCLRKQKDDRYPSMTELKRALMSLEREVIPSLVRAHNTIPSPPGPSPSFASQHPTLDALAEPLDPGVFHQSRADRDSGPLRAAGRPGSSPELVARERGGSAGYNVATPGNGVDELITFESSHYAQTNSTTTTTRRSRRSSAALWLGGAAVLAAFLMTGAWLVVSHDAGDMPEANAIPRTEPILTTPSPGTQVPPSVPDEPLPPETAQAPEEVVKPAASPPRPAGRPVTRPSAATVTTQAATAQPPPTSVPSPPPQTTTDELGRRK